jgi:hypothetical protein
MHVRPSQRGEELAVFRRDSASSESYGTATVSKRLGATSLVLFQIKKSQSALKSFRFAASKAYDKL